jgi:hypothetical protein
MKKWPIWDIIIHNNIDRNYKQIIATDKNGKLIAVNFNFKRVF